MSELIIFGLSVLKKQFIFIDHKSLLLHPFRSSRQNNRVGGKTRRKKNHKPKKISSGDKSKVSTDALVTRTKCNSRLFKPPPKEKKNRSLLILCAHSKTAF